MSTLWGPMWMRPVYGYLNGHAPVCSSHWLWAGNKRVSLASLEPPVTDATSALPTLQVDNAAGSATSPRCEAVSRHPYKRHTRCPTCFSAWLPGPPVDNSHASVAARQDPALEHRSRSKNHTYSYDWETRKYTAKHKEQPNSTLWANTSTSHEQSET